LQIPITLLLSISPQYLFIKCCSHSASTILYSSMVVLASSTEECPLFEKQEQQQTWISLCSSSLARRFREMLTFSGNPPFRFNKGILDVSRVSAFGWEYLRALKSLCMAWPTTTFPERIFRIWGGKERTFEQAPVYHAAQWRVLPHKQSDAQNQEHGSITLKAHHSQPSKPTTGSSQSPPLTALKAHH
uniref:Uncharacterized protein n=1 Tax=Coturnix japonica TaxID=93934 RepID=A0A8C2TPU4_COTJA